jgi:hypothetical protein
LLINDQLCAQHLFGSAVEHKKITVDANCSCHCFGIGVFDLLRLLTGVFQSNCPLTNSSCNRLSCNIVSCNPLQDLFGGSLLSQVSATVNFTAPYPDVPSPEIFSLTENFTLDFLDFDLELDREDVATTFGCIRTVAALSMGQGLIHAAATHSPGSSSSSSSVAPMQLYNWAHGYADAAAAGKFNSKLQAKATTESAAATCTPNSSSSSRAGRVIAAAAADGGLVACCCTQQQQQQGWGVYLPPGAEDAPVLASVSTRVLPVMAAAAAAGSSTSVVLQVQCRNVDLQQHTLLVKHGRQIHSLPLLPVAAAAAAGCYAVELPPGLLLQPGVLLLSLATQRYYISGSQAVLLLPCEQAVADELNEM